MQVSLTQLGASFAVSIALSLLALFGSGCTMAVGLVHQGERLVTNGKNDHTLDDADGNEMGKSVGLLVTNVYPPVDNAKLVEYVNLVGFSLVAESDQPDGQYVFSVLDTRDIGAYAGPGGFIFITRGAIASMHDEAELAGVLAHELAHVLDHHAIDAATAAGEKDGFMDAKTQGIMTSDGGRYLDAGINAAVRNGYDRGAELDADKQAVRLLVAAGYDPRSYAGYLQRLAALEKTDDRKKLTTHFDYGMQSDFVGKEIAAQGATGGATMKERFAAAVGN